MSFLLNPVPFNGQEYEQRKGTGTSYQSLFRLQNKYKKIPLLVITTFDEVIQSGLCQPIHETINYSTFICIFESGKCGKEGKKLLEIE